MRVVVFSDSHNNFFALQSIVEDQPEAGVFLHLGDGAREFDDLQAIYPEKRMLFVRGNCDWSSDAKLEDLLICGSKRIFFTHGHVYQVKIDLDKLLERAKMVRADIVCYGHTHLRHNTYTNGIHVLNPGSVTTPKTTGPSYGVIDITPAGIAVHHVFL